MYRLYTIYANFKKKKIKKIYCPMTVASSSFALADGWEFSGNNNGNFTFVNAKEGKTITYTSDKAPDGVTLDAAAKDTANQMKQKCGDEPKINFSEDSASITCNVNVSENLVMPVETILGIEEGEMHVLVLTNGATKQDVEQLMQQSQEAK